mmetsp:Transcript_18309/g.25810  ORF Transcript_18309/g.25810 Transcript_18309/m.25810 type:complete len:165 (-) Transcript_18309:265-759(-)
MNTSRRYTSSSSSNVFSTNIWKLFTVIFATVSLVLYLGTDSSIDSLKMAASSSTPAFTLLVTVKFSAEEHMETFFADIKPLCDYIRESEPTTIGFEVLKSDRDPLLVTIMERYVDKEEAFLNIHRSSEPFLAFRPKLKALQDAGFVEISGNSFLDSQLGFADRA